MREDLPLVDLLLPVVETLKSKCREFGEVEATFADQVVALLGRASRMAGT
ncbi:MAG: hypothetical protein ACTSU5_00010 [Promethearchaeota archaeon]